MFQLLEGYARGAISNADLRAGKYGKMIGTPLLRDYEAGIIGQVVLNCGDKEYVEFGTGFGGSLIVAGLVKRWFRLDGDLVSVDGWGQGNWTDAVEGGEMSYKNARANIDMVIGSDKVLFFSEDTIAMEAKDFGGCDIGCLFIDGDHSPAVVKHDLGLAQQLSPDYIVMHDVDQKQVYEEAISLVASHPNKWRLAYFSGRMAVLESVQ